MLLLLSDRFYLTFYFDLILALETSYKNNSVSVSLTQLPLKLMSYLGYKFQAVFKLPYRQCSLYVPASTRGWVWSTMHRPKETKAGDQGARGTHRPREPWADLRPPLSFSA